MSESKLITMFISLLLGVFVFLTIKLFYENRNLKLSSRQNNNPTCREMLSDVLPEYINCQLDLIQCRFDLGKVQKGDSHVNGNE